MKSLENPVGRPPATPEELETTLQKLRPYLENGLSMEKACSFASVPVRNVYLWMETHDWFLQRIHTYKNYKSKVVSDVFRYKVEMIKFKIGLLDELRKKLSDPTLDSPAKVLLIDQIDKLELNGGEISFLQWIAQNDKALRDEYGARTEVTGKDGAPLGQVLDSLEAPKKTDYAQLGQTARGQMVEINPPIQNQEQVGGTSDFPAEFDATSTPGGEGQPQ